MGHLSRKLHALLERSASWVGGGRSSTAAAAAEEEDVEATEKEGSKQQQRRQLSRRWSWGSSSGGGTPKGYLPVRAGDSDELFYIRTEQLNHPLIADLLRRSAEEYGFDTRYYTGALRLPCDPTHLRLLLRRLRFPHSSAISASSASIYNSCSLQHHHQYRHSDMALIQ